MASSRRGRRWPAAWLAAALALAGCRGARPAGDGESAGASAMRRARPAVAFEILHDSPDRMLILDLREPAEFTGSLGHVRGAVNVPLAELPFRLEELAAHRENTFLVYCRNDDCGERGMATLRSAGFEGATLIVGGIEAWVDDGFGTVDVTAPPPPTPEPTFVPAGPAAVADEEAARGAAERAPPKPGEAYLRLADGSLILPPRRPAGFYVRGRLAGGRFFPSGGVLGQGEFCSPEGAARGRETVGNGLPATPAWIELTDGMLYSAATARTPQPPLVRGCVGADGHFRPASRDVDH